MQSTEPLPRATEEFLTPKRLRLYLGALLVLQAISCFLCWSVVRTGYIDFRTFYTAGYMARSGHAAELYDYQAEMRFQNELIGSSNRALPMMCPPYTSLLFAPLSYMGFRYAYLAFLFLNLCFLVIAALLMTPHLSALSSRWRAGPLLLWLSFFPAGVALMMGQISALLLLIYCLSWLCLQANKPLLAGLLLSLALMKFQIALPIAILYLLWRQWRVVSGFVLGAIALTGVSAVMLGLRNLLPYMHSLAFMTTAISPEQASQLKFGIFPALMPNLYGLLFSLTDGAHFGVTLVLTASVALFVWAAMRPPSFVLAILVAMLVSYHMFLYDLTLLLLPISLVVNQLANSKEEHPTGSRLGITATKAASAALLIAPIELVLISLSASYLLALPIGVITLCEKAWRSPEL